MRQRRGHGSRGAETVLVVEDEPAVCRLGRVDPRWAGLPGARGNAGDALELSTSYAGQIDSGHDEDDVAGYGVLATGSMFLPKPFTVAALTERVRCVLDGQDW